MKNLLIIPILLATLVSCNGSYKEIDNRITSNKYTLLDIQEDMRSMRLLVDSLIPHNTIINLVSDNTRCIKGKLYSRSYTSDIWLELGDKCIIITEETKEVINP